MPALRPALDVQIVQRVSDITPEKWNALAQDRPFASHGWIQFGESVLPNETPFHILLSRDGELIARATFWLLRNEPLPVQGKAIRTVMGTIFRHLPLLMCRTPLIDMSGLILPDDAALRQTALTTIADAAREIGRKYRASFTAFDYLEPDDINAAGFPCIVINEPSTRLINQWDTFDTYLKSLGSGVRKDFNRHRNRAADMGIVIQSHKQVTNLDRAIELIRNVENEHHAAPNPYVRRLLENAHHADATWLTAEIDGVMVGCGLVIGDGSSYLLTALGLDYSVKYVYFQMVYAAIQTAINKGAKVLRGGGGAYDFKARLGFEQVHNTRIAFVTNHHSLARFVQRLAG